MKRFANPEPGPRRGFASCELLIVIAIIAIALAAATPVMERVYAKSLVWFAARGESIGWLQQFMAAGFSLVVGACWVGILYGAFILLSHGAEWIGGFWQGFNEARKDLNRQWRDRA